MSTRRTFLGTTATLVAALPATTSAAPSMHYPEIGPVLATTRRHRQVFGVRAVHNGTALHQMMNSLNAYEHARNEGPGTLRPIAVLYGPAVALALDDATWRRYQVAKALATEGDAVARPASFDENPFLRALPETSEEEDASIAALVARGAHLLVCDNALTGFALTLVTLGTALHPDAVAADLRAHLIPGATLVPAGVAALNDAQEAKYTYVAVG